MRREPLLLGTIGAVIGIVIAVVVFGGRGGTGPIGASGGPTLPEQSSAPPTVAVVSPVPSPVVTVAPPTAIPTATPPPPTPRPTRTPKPTPTPNTSPTIVSFDVPGQEDCTGTTAGSVNLSWEVKNATGVTISIDGPGIYMAYPGLEKEESLPYGCSPLVLEHTYTITTVGGTGPADSVTKTIKTRAPSITSFEMGEPDCSGDRFVGISMSYEVRAATGAELQWDGAVYSTYNSKASDDIVQYDCQKESITYRLTTTGGYGEPAHQDIVVVRPAL